MTLPAAEAAVHGGVAPPGPFTAEAAAALTPDLGRVAVRDALRGLLHRSLLLRAGPVGPGRPSRFAQLETVRAHAAAASADELPAAWAAPRRLGGRARLGRPRLGHPRPVGLDARLDNDLVAVRSTLQCGLVQAPSALGVRTASRLNHYWYFRGMSLEAGRWLELAVGHAPLAGSFEATVARLTLAAYLARTGRQDLAEPLLRQAVTDPARLPGEQALVVGESLSTFCGASVHAPYPEPIDEQAGQVRVLADATGDERLDLLADLCAALTIDPYARPAELLDAMTGVYERAVGVGAGNRYAARIAAAGVTLSATVLGRVELGMEWSERTLARHHEVGIQYAPLATDARANLLALAGANHAAVRLYAAARAHARRTGMRWPTGRLAEQLHEQARSALSTADLQREQREGVRLRLRDVDAIGLGGTEIGLTGG